MPSGSLSTSVPALPLPRIDWAAGQSLYRTTGTQHISPILLSRAPLYLSSLTLGGELLGLSSAIRAERALVLICGCTFRALHQQLQTRGKGSPYLMPSALRRVLLLPGLVLDGMLNVSDRQYSHCTASIRQLYRRESGVLCVFFIACSVSF